MEAIVLAARILLSAVFLVAGAAKLADLSGSRRALHDFGLPDLLAQPLGVALPLAEFLIAAALLPAQSAWYGAAAALTLLVGFAAAIGINLALGRTPDCHCFGQLHSAPAGWSTLARNVALGLAAAFVVGNGPAAAGPSAIAWIADLNAAEGLIAAASLVAFAFLAGQSFLLFQVLQQQGRLLARLDALGSGAAAAPTKPVSAAPSLAGLPIGAPAPSFELDSVGGRKVTLRDIMAEGKPALLFFTNPGCGPCTMLLPEIARWQRNLSGLNFVVISEGSAKDNSATVEAHGLATVLLQKKREVATAYLANGTPAAVLVRPDGSIGSALALGADAIRALVANVLGLGSTAVPSTAPADPARPIVRSAPAPTRPIALGERAPPIALTSIDGAVVALPDLRGARTLLLFWNTGCGFCLRMLEDLRAWEADPPPGAPRLVLVSAGSVDDMRTMRLDSLLLVDNELLASSAFGANGTPMAVTLDAQARVASSVAAGASAVLALAAGGRAATGNGGMPELVELSS